MEKITGFIQGIGSVQGSVTLPDIISPEKYRGSYEFTPTEEQQTILAKDLIMMDDIVINPIPSNYGLITWNGSTLTVS